VKIGVEDLAFAQHLSLFGLWFLDLHDHVGPGKYFIRSRYYFGAGFFIICVGCANAVARIFLDPCRVTVTDSFTYRYWCHANTVFVVLDFLWYADEHCASP
jgi:hypothetical protein